MIANQPPLLVDTNMTPRPTVFCVVAVVAIAAIAAKAVSEKEHMEKVVVLMALFDFTHNLVALSPSPTAPPRPYQPAIAAAAAVMWRR